MKLWVFILSIFTVSQVVYGQNDIYTTLNGSQDKIAGTHSVGCSDVLTVTSSDDYDVLSPKCKKLHIFVLLLKKSISTLVLQELANRNVGIVNAKFYYDVVSSPDQEDLTINLLVRFEENAGMWDFIETPARTNEFTLPPLSNDAFFWAEYISTTELKPEDKMHVLVSYQAEVDPVVDLIANQIEAIVNEM